LSANRCCAANSPLWNPEQGLGFSVVANPLYGLFYPPHWLYLITPRSLVASMVTWQAFGHLVWGTVGMVVLARRLGLPAVAAGITGPGLGPVRVHDGRLDHRPPALGRRLAALGGGGLHRARPP